MCLTGRPLLLGQGRGRSWGFRAEGPPLTRDSCFPKEIEREGERSSEWGGEETWVILPTYTDGSNPISLRTLCLLPGQGHGGGGGCLLEPQERTSSLFGSLAKIKMKWAQEGTQGQSRNTEKQERIQRGPKKKSEKTERKKEDEERMEKRANQKQKEQEKLTAGGGGGGAGRDRREGELETEQDRDKGEERKVQRNRAKKIIQVYSHSPEG